MPVSSLPKATSRVPRLTVAALAAGLAVAMVLTATPRAANMPVSAIKPGMRGVGRTVFQGTVLEDFQADIIGVLENTIGPQRNLILAKLSGGPLATTGVIAGMSGSPVYIDGQLIGAVSYSLGQFVKEPIAGITPIAEMVEATDLPPRRVARLGPVSSPAEVARWVGDELGLRQPFASTGQAVRGVGMGAAEASQFGLQLRPIATPLSLAGFSSDAVSPLTEVLQGAGFTPQFGAPMATSQQAQGRAPALAPGDAVGVSLVRGDLAMGATGTVTHVEGSRVYAFGHPFFNLGPANFPMTRAFVHTLLPSYLSSSKLASLGDVVGTVTQDRATAIAGTLGPGPALMPVRLVLNADRTTPRTFTFEVAKDQLMTPLLTMVSLFNTLTSFERQAGAATFSVKGEAKVRGHAPLVLDDAFAGDPPTVGTALYVVQALASLLQNDRAAVDLEGLDLTITSSEQPRTATIERAWVDAVRLRPGQTVGLRVVTRNYRGEETLRPLNIAIPSTASGTLQLTIADGTRLAQSEQRDARRMLQAQGVDQLIRAFNARRRSNRIYVKLSAQDAGATIDGEPLPGLPPSVLAVLESDRQSGQFRALTTTTLGEWEIPIDAQVTGTRTLTLTLDGQ